MHIISLPLKFLNNNYYYGITTPVIYINNYNNIALDVTSTQKALR